MKTIVFTGGGSAGHVTPNVALISRLKREGWKIDYIGSRDGIEQQIIAETGVPFHPVASGKLRRYFDLKNFKDPFKVMQGVLQSYMLLRRLKPRVVFSKGGFVSVPVVAAAWLHRIPVVIHESDMTPGLANRLSLPFAARICVTFPETLEHLSGKKAVRTGLPIREEVLAGSPEKGLRLCDFTGNKPVLLVMGGSLGSKAINEAVRSGLPGLLDRFQVVHLCGKGNLDPSLGRVRGYKQFEYVSRELPDLAAMASLVVSRAGSTSLNEFLALKKPMVLIPLTLQASRGDQILNARSFEKAGYAMVLHEENLTAESLRSFVWEVYENRREFILRMAETPYGDGLERVIRVIRETAGV
jgi:UDP-N-acetylglucosamine--N-acetylmuramyl-(pentapeptide) pyrophosphoryl-undecaprenol N-acetylglucosamine transferase